MQHLEQIFANRSILITGGAGYIGRVTKAMFEFWGSTVWILDDLSGSARPKDIKHFIEGSILDLDLLEKIFSERHFDAVVHLAGKINVGESVEKPEEYWLHNVVGTERLITSMPEDSCVLFASSAAVYGNSTDCVKETDACIPTSPYGWGKLKAEEIIQNSHLRSICYRLFNVSGAIQNPDTPFDLIGEEHDPETHLIPRVIQQHLDGNPFAIFGSTHNTPDGTCLREYIHVLDVVHAFKQGLIHLWSDLSSLQQHSAFNLSSGAGLSVLDVINTIDSVGQSLGHAPIQYHFTEARAGDPSRIAGDISAAYAQLDWKPEYSQIHRIVHSTWYHQLSLHMLANPNNIHSKKKL